MRLKPTRSLLSLATTIQDGPNWMICNQSVNIIVQLSTAIKFTSLGDIIDHCESKIIILYSLFTVLLSYTEIWSDDEGSKNIKLAEPILSAYYYYPELVLVDVNFCVKPWGSLNDNFLEINFSFKSTVGVFDLIIELSAICCKLKSTCPLLTRASGFSTRQFGSNKLY